MSISRAKGLMYIYLFIFVLLLYNFSNYSTYFRFLYVHTLHPIVWRLSEVSSLVRAVKAYVHVEVLIFSFLNFAKDGIESQASRSPHCPLNMS